MSWFFWLSNSEIFFEEDFLRISGSFDENTATSFDVTFENFFIEMSALRSDLRILFEISIL